MKRFSLVLLGAACFGSLALGGAPIAVIANHKLALQHLSNEEIRAYFLGEARFTASGQAVRIADRDRQSELHRDFYAVVANMTPKDVSVYWARKVFTGAATAPARLPGDDAATLAWVRLHADGLSYVAAGSVDPSVRVVGTLNPPR